MSLRISVSRVAGATAVLAVAVAAAVGGTAAAPRPAAAINPITVPELISHGDSLETASNWSEAGASFVVATPAWCGTVRADDDLVNEVAQNGNKWHVVVAVPTDIAADFGYTTGGGRDRLLDQAFQSVKTIETFYKARVGMGGPAQTPLQWTLRFDYGTSCGAQFPDISVYHLPRSQAQYTTQPYSLLAADLDASNLYERSNKRYLVHYAGKSDYCGQSYIYAPTDNSGGAKYSMTYNLHTLAKLSVSTVLCDWTVDAHEIGHSMGAATGGPLNNDGAHTWDCENDVMSYGGPICADGLLYYDYNENNYFGHTGSWYDTDQSGYWCKPTC